MRATLPALPFALLCVRTVTAKNLKRKYDNPQLMRSNCFAFHHYHREWGTLKFQLSQCTTHVCKFQAQNNLRICKMCVGVVRLWN